MYICNKKSMFRPILFFVFLCSTSLWSQQLVINELDANDLSIDNEEFIELKSSVPNFSTLHLLTIEAI